MLSDAVWTAAVNAAREIVSQPNVAIEDLIADLEGLKEEIDTMIEALESDLEYE